MCRPSYNLSHKQGTLYRSIQQKGHIFDMKFNHPLNVANQYNTHSNSTYIVVILAVVVATATALSVCRCCLLLCMRNMCIFIHCHKNRPTKKKETNERKNIFIINEFIYNMFLFFSLFDVHHFHSHPSYQPFNNIFHIPPSLLLLLCSDVQSFFSVCIL